MALDDATPARGRAATARSRCAQAGRRRSRGTDRVRQRRDRERAQMGAAAEPDLRRRQVRAAVRAVREDEPLGSRGPGVEIIDGASGSSVG